MTHTSGTTGIPKLICHSANSMGWRTKWQRTVFTKIAETKLVAFHISPVHSRFNIGISSLMSMGFPMMPLASANGPHVVRMLKENPPIALETHPNNFVQWRFVAEEHPEALLEYGIITPHSMPSIIKQWQLSYKLLPIKMPSSCKVYGQSECGPMILKAHTLESIQSNDARDMGIGFRRFDQSTNRRC